MHFTLDTLQTRRLFEQGNDMIPVHIALTGDLVVVPLPHIVVQVAIHHVGQEFFQNVIIPRNGDADFFKRSAGRALVLAVSSLKARNGSGSTAWHLAQMLKKYDFRVLLLGKDDLNTDSLPLAGSIENLLAREAGNWDFIIIDTPDSRNSSIPLIVGRLADFMLLVCDYRNSPGYLLSVVLWRFRKAQVKIAGCVINHFPIRKRYADFDAYQHSFYRYNPQ